MVTVVVCATWCCHHIRMRCRWGCRVHTRGTGAALPCVAITSSCDVGGGGERQQCNSVTKGILLFGWIPRHFVFIRNPGRASIRCVILSCWLPHQWSKQSPSCAPKHPAFHMSSQHFAFSALFITLLLLPPPPPPGFCAAPSGLCFRRVLITALAGMFAMQAATLGTCCHPPLRARRSK